MSANSIAEKFEVIADEVYAKGREDERVRFWNGFTNYGTRRNYHNSFPYADYSGMTIPKGLCKPITRVSNMFYEYYGRTLPLGIDCSQFDINGSASYHAILMFRNAKNLVEIYDMGLPVQKTYDNCYSYCPLLTKIAVIRSDENTIWNNTFYDCASLEELEIEGKIGKNGFDVSGCAKLTHKSLMSIVNATATILNAQTLTLGTTNLAKLTDAEKAIAIDRGWTLA